MANTNDLTTAYFAITKADKNEDGTLMVYGKATDDSLDIDDQICDPTWLDTAMPNWFKTGGNVREQHSSIAAGVAKEYEKKADGHYINVLVVDPVSVKKVDSGVLKGFSIGIKSPRVIQDTKAANGRIIDGQIVEVSLVDRPANPNCQLLLAKSVDGESGVWKVEELIEKSDEVTPETTEVVAEVVAEEIVAKEAEIEAVVEEAVVVEETPAVEEAAVEETPIAEIVEEEKLAELGIEKSAKAKAILGEILKFDKAKYEAAREALAGLIEVEAGEMKEGSNEIYSISHLLEAVAHLAMWYEGEEAEGEVIEEIKEASAEAEEKKTAEVEEVPTEEADKEKISEVTEEVAAEDIEAIVEKAVKSATESIRSEVVSLVAAKEAAIEKATTLESELATAKSLAIGGGPKRTAKPIDSTTNDLMTKALVFKAKANAATDPTLAKGYKALSEEYLAAYAADTK